MSGNLIGRFGQPPAPYQEWQVTPTDQQTYFTYRTVKHLEPELQKILQLLQQQNNQPGPNPSPSPDKPCTGCACEDIRKIIQEELAKLPKPTNGGGGGNSGNSDGLDFSDLKPPPPPYYLFPLEDRGRPSNYQESQFALDNKPANPDKKPATA